MVPSGGARRCDSGEGVRRLVGVSGGGGAGYVSTALHEDLLARMMQSHTIGDFCLVGGKVHVCGCTRRLMFWSVFACPPFYLLQGTRKATLVKRFASLLDYDVEPVVLFQV